MAKPCPQCGMELRSDLAQQCFSCGANWRPPSEVPAIKKESPVSVRLIDTIPQLIKEANDQDREAATRATETIKKLRDMIPDGMECPRCGSSRTTAGNVTGWKCQTCGLKYKSQGFFSLSGPAPMCKPKELIELLDNVLQAKLEESKGTHWWSDVRQQAEQLVTERRKFLESL